MAQQGKQLDSEKLCCSICLDLLKDPVTIPCGHSYCMSCITSQWDEEDSKGTHSCPQCRQVFTPRPVLVKNTMLAELVEEVKASEAAPADLCSAGPGDVSCDFCTGRKLKAVKSCLVCMVSYCEKHLQPHYVSPAFEKHKLVSPSSGLQESICSRHNEVMKIFCRTDQQSICILCSMDEHKGHDTVSAAAEVAERQKRLGVSRQTIQQGIQSREEEVKVLQQRVEAINQCADDTVRDCEAIIADVKQQIRSRQETELGRVEEFREKLEREVTELKRRDAELEQLSRTEDPTLFLHSYPSLSQPGGAAESPRIDIPPLLYSEDVAAVVSGARDQLQDVLNVELGKMSLTETTEDVLLPQEEPNTRDGFLEYSKKITMDTNTAHAQLQIESRKQANISSSQYNSKLPHPDRFTDWQQVLSTEALTGRCYWEVQWNGEVFIAVGYGNMSRTGRESVFGHNAMSWALQCSSNSASGCYVFKHNNIRTPVSGPWSSRIGVYLDHRAGILSFYSVSETVTLLHRVQTTFTQPLHAGVAVHVSGSAKLCDAGDKLQAPFVLPLLTPAFPTDFRL